MRAGGLIGHGMLPSIKKRMLMRRVFSPEEWSDLVDVDRVPVAASDKRLQ